MGKSLSVSQLFDSGWSSDNDFPSTFNNLSLFFTCPVDIYTNLFKHGIILGKKFDFNLISCIVGKTRILLSNETGKFLKIKNTLRLIYSLTV